MKRILLACGLLVSSFASPGADMSNGADNFFKSDKVTAEKVTFLNQYKMKVTGNLYIPKGVDPKAKNPAIIVGHPMGAVKEQSASLYAQKLAEQGFVTLAIDLSFFGESEGQPRNAVSPEMFTESFNAAVDYLGTRPFVDRNRIGVIGICGSGSFAISAAKIDPRLKAIATVSMYDMGSVTRNGLRKGLSLEQRKAMIAAAAEQRYAEFTGGETKWVDYLPVKLPADADPIRREFYDFYRTPRGQVVPEGMTVEQSQNRPISSEVKFNNFYPFEDIETISPRPMLFITGSEAHSREFSEDAYKRAGEPKELFIVPGAGHVDLYDRVDLIPFNKLTEFFKTNLK
ncbi:fermentation/respiration switch protein [Serratia plymuthica]|uniref:alpha/beta hydrolase n=1 Tax=Serratia plymuthica TaxID=82996 RepID=UPI000F6DD5B1|nr:alpha/beta hydrolase [Serratia plymuthica]NIC29380.1 alpha/beta hydrolase [Serratia plymuthica]VEI19060.1 fermentation/respiration switch protein [Serratia plymuthica]